MILKETFREDLFYRINLISLNLPSLQERKGDISLLFKHFLNNLEETYKTGSITINLKTLNWLQNLSFPGNIREVKNLVERTWLISGKSELEIEDFEKALEQTTNKSSGSFPLAGSMTLDEIEKEMILKTLEKYRNNLTKVAKSLGLSRGSLYRRLEKYGIPYNSEI
jgi:DNA-binding NtrC family response regulator